MALQNGIITGAMKESISGALEKVNDFPSINNNANTFLNGAGEWVTIAIPSASSADGGLMSAADKAFLDALRTGQIANPTTNASTGALEYKYNDTVIHSIPVASGE